MKVEESSSQFLPPNWTWTRIGEIGQVITGTTPPKKDENNYGDFIPFVKPPQLNACGIDNAPDNLSEKGAKLARILPPNSVLVSCIGTLGKTGITRVPVAFNQQINAIILSTGVLPKFVFFYFQYSKTKERLNKIASATTIPIVNKSKFETIAFPLASTKEQTRIINRIELLFSFLDAGVESLRKVPLQLRCYRQVVLKYAVEGRLSEEWRKTNKNNLEPARVLIEKIISNRRVQWEAAEFARLAKNGKTIKNSEWKKRYKTPETPEIGSLPSLPEGWAWTNWNQISNWVTYGFTRPMPHVPKGISIITAKNVKNRRIEFETADKTTQKAFSKLSEKDRPKSGDILITKDGTIGKASVVPDEVNFCINQSVAVIWLRSNPLDRNYLLTVIESPVSQKLIWKKARGVAIQHLSITDFAKMTLPIPPLPEQSVISAKVDRYFSICDTVEKALQESLLQSKLLRQRILKNAFEGKIVPQDPNDEPAEMLLRLIKEQKRNENNNNSLGLMNYVK